MSLSKTCQRPDTTFHLYRRRMIRSISVNRQGHSRSITLSVDLPNRLCGAPKKLHIFNSTLSCTLFLPPSLSLLLSPVKYQCDLNIQYHRRRAISALGGPSCATKGRLSTTCQNKNQYFSSRRFLFRRMIGRNRALPSSSSPSPF